MKLLSRRQEPDFYDPEEEITAEQKMALVCGAIFYPAWAYAFKLLQFPGTYDSVLERSYVACAELAVFFAISYSTWAKRRVKVLAFIVKVVLSMHYFYLLHVNQMHPAYAIGAFVMVFAVTAFMSSKDDLIYYSLFVVPLGWVASSGSELNLRVFFILGLTTALFVSYLTTARRVEHIHREIRSKSIIVKQQARIANGSKLSALGEMAGGIAHEINNPLAVIQLRTELMAELLASKPLDEALVLKMCSEVQMTVNRISKIVAGLRAFSRDGSNDPVQRERVEGIICSTLDLCREKFANRDVKLMEEQCDTQVSVECRGIQLSQILLNLLSNAMDAAAHTSQKWVKISTEVKNDHIEIRVTDSGSGIPEQVREKLFQPFFTTKELGQGTGLGLSISQGLAQSNGGALRYNPDCPNTQFVLSFPIAKPIQAVA